MATKKSESKTAKTDDTPTLDPAAEYDRLRREAEEPKPVPFDEQPAIIQARIRSRRTKGEVFALFRALCGNTR